MLETTINLNLQRKDGSVMKWLGIALMTVMFSVVGCSHPQQQPTYEAKTARPEPPTRQEAMGTLLLPETPTQTAPPKPVENKIVEVASSPPAQLTKPVMEMYKGQAAVCSDLPAGSQMWEMKQCDELEDLRNGKKPVVFDLSGWVALQKGNEKYEKTILPIGRKTVLKNLTAPSTAKFKDEAIINRCMDKDIFITMHVVDAQNGFGATIRDNVCTGISLKDKSSVMIDCGSVVNLINNLTNQQYSLLSSSVQLSCQLASTLLHSGMH